MRLRQLGQGQSIKFLAPPNVDQEIRLYRNLMESTAIDGRDVLAWSTNQSCLHIERSQPLRIIRGLSYYERQRTAEKHLAAPLKDSHIDLRSLSTTATESFIEHEKQSLNDMYAPLNMGSSIEPGIVSKSRADAFHDVKELVRAWDTLGSKVAVEASVHEEHEREITHEVEEETQVQRPGTEVPAEPIYDRRLDPLLSNRTLESLLRFPSAKDAILPVFSGAPSSSAADFWKGIRTSRGFISVVKDIEKDHLDPFFRPVNWVLTSKIPAATSQLVLIPQYEANLV